MGGTKPPSFCSSDSFYRQVLCTQNLAIGFAPIPSFASVPEAKLIQDTIETRSCRAPTGRHITSTKSVDSALARRIRTAAIPRGHELLARPSWRTGFAGWKAAQTEAMT